SFIHEKFPVEEETAPDIQEKIMELSIGLKNEMRALYKSIGKDELPPVTFRETRMFNEHFSEWYPKERTKGNIVRLFVLTAHNIYGRLITDKASREEFIKAVIRVINKDETLVGIAQMESDIFRDPGTLRALVDKTISYAHYEDIDPDAGKTGKDVPAKRKIRALIERAREVSSSLLLMLGENTVMFRDVMNDMYKEKDKEIIELSMNGFTRRRELFGMYVPIAKMDESRLKRVDTASAGDIEKALKAVCDIDARVAALGAQKAEVDRADPESDKILDRINEQIRILNRYHEDWYRDGGAKDDPNVRWAVAMYLEHGDKWRDFFRWEDGVISKQAKRARENPDMKFFLVFNNIEVCPAWVRVLLNPVLWEKSVSVSGSGKEVGIPKNLSMIFTMDKDADLKDPSFMDRHLVHMAEDVDEVDSLAYLGSDAVDPLRRSGLSESASRKLAELFAKIKGFEYSETPGIRLIDMIEIAKRVKGLANDGSGYGEDKLIERETYNYFHLRLRSRGDRELLRQAVSDEMDVNSADIKPSLSIDMGSGMMDFDGAKIKMSDKFLKFCRERRDLVTDEARIRGYNGYIVQDLEKRVLGQIARVYRYGNKVMQIEGPSGEGKTEIGKVFASLTEIGDNVNEKLVSVETDLSEFRGQVRPTSEGHYYLYEPGYVNEFRTGKHLFLVNEINTNAEGALYHWFYPEISGSAYKSLTEYPGDGDVIGKRIAIDRNNLWLFTVNPDTMDGREPTPKSISYHLPVFYMATDDEDIPAFTEKVFRDEINDQDLMGNDRTGFIEAISGLYIALRDEVKRCNMKSPQDITKRSILESASELAEDLGRMPAREAFRGAVEKCFINKWKIDEDKDTARALAEDIAGEILGEKGLFAREISDGEYDEMLDDAVKPPAKGRFRPRMLFVDSSTRDSKALQDEIENITKASAVHEVILSFFHGKRRLIGGFMPSEDERTYEGAFAPMDAVSRKFRNGLGIIPELIFEARKDPARTHYGIFHNYNDLNSKVAPILNGFLQTGRLETIENYVTEEIARELLVSFLGDWKKLLAQKDMPLWIRDKLPKDRPRKGDIDPVFARCGMDLAKWFYSTAPYNLEIIAICSSVEESKLGAAEFDRFSASNISRKLSEEKIKGYIKANMPSLPGGFARYEEVIIGRAVECFRLHDDPNMKAKYDDRSAMSIKDLGAYMSGLADTDGAVIARGDVQKAIDDAAYFAMGLALRPEFREKLTFGYDLDKLARDVPKEGGELTLTGNLALQLSLMGKALKNNRRDNFMPVIFEGEPGGGKTAACEEFAKRLGLPIYKNLMYQDIDIGEFLGRISKKGKKFVMTTTEKEKKKDDKGSIEKESFILDFLKAYTEGGVYLLDEGAMGYGASKIINYLVEISKRKTFDLGTYQPGLGLGSPEGLITRSRDFMLVIAQNPPDTNEGREYLSHEVVTSSMKMWVDNVMSEGDAVLIIDHYLGSEKDAIDVGLKKKIAALHNEFAKNHPFRYELSPRQLIRIARIMAKAGAKGADVKKAVFAGIMLSYMSRLDDDGFREEWKKVEEIMGGEYSSYLADWGARVKLDGGRADGFLDWLIISPSSHEGNIEWNDMKIFESIPSESKALRQIILSMQLAEPVALLAQDGADSYDLVKKAAYITGYELETLWAHEQTTRNHILYSVLPKFKGFFSDRGIKEQEAGEEFKLRTGFLLSHMLTKEEYNLDAAKGEPHRHVMLYFSMMDSVPERQRVLLNDILTRGEITIQDESGRQVLYKLPEWIHVVVSASEEHKFSSAFINRFVPVRVNSLLGYKPAEIEGLIRSRYNLVREDEREWLWQVCAGVNEFDVNKNFALKYGFSAQDLMKLAETLHLEKARDIENGRYGTRPYKELYYFLKAVYLVYYAGMSPEDRDKMEDDVFRQIVEYVFGREYKAAAFKNILEEVMGDILSGLEEKGAPYIHTVKLDAARLDSEKGQVLPCGIMVKRRDGMLYVTPRLDEEFVTVIRVPGEPPVIEHYRAERDHLKYVDIEIVH
ncbi:MAG: AAA family ATPase, partial [Candidatus Omnitrophica bacterium]|nr:AAA family ATPase [Candidatus Omnitrophota bacterium]